MNPNKAHGPLAWTVASLTLALGLAAGPAGATTYVMMADQDLADQAPVIAVVRVAGSAPADAGFPATEYRATVERAVKGGVSGSVRIVVPGDDRFRVIGAPRFRAGERALVFLEPRTDGAYGIVQAMLGAFHEVPAAGAGTPLALRDLSEGTELTPPGRAPVGGDGPRHFDRFVEWLADRAAGHVRAPDYFVPGAVAPPPGEFNQLGDGRWFQFDTGNSVQWFALPSGQTGMPGGGFPEFLAALQAWNLDPATPISLTYGGTSTNSSGNCNAVNVIRWNDPLNQIPGSFSCTSGGILAQGGYCVSGTGTFNGEIFDRISDGDIVIQDGAGCFLAGNGNLNGEEVFGHELGHTLGLGHSCGDASSGPCIPGSLADQALMRAIAHGDGRGAALNADDRAGIDYLYAPNVPLPTLSISDVTVTEANVTVNAVFSVSLSSSSTQTVTVNFSTANGTALAGSDYTAVSGVVTFNPGQTTEVITVPVLGDLIDEPTENFFVNLATPANATIADGQATGTIQDNDPPPALSVNDCALPEGNTGQTNCTFNVTLSAPSAFPISVGFATTDGTATNGLDYFGGSATLTFPAGSTSQQLPVAIVGDLFDEPDETYLVNLSGPVNATLADAQGLGTILDDDAAPGLSVSDCTVTEGDAGQVLCAFTVSLSGASGFPISVAYATADVTATAGLDYIASAGTLSFAAGSTAQVVNVPVVGDLLDENDETFTLDLSAPTNASITDGQGLGTIVDNDPQPSVSVSDCAVVEGNAGTVACVFTVSLSAPSSFAVGVSWATADATATAGVDYMSGSGTLSFTPGSAAQTMTVQVLGDTAVEPDETFLLNLTSPTNATLGDAQGVGTIGDDDAPSLSSNELTHGAVQHADLQVRPDLYRIGQKPYSSYEVLIDGTSGDMVPVTLERLSGDNVAVLQSAVPVAVGDSVSLRFENTTALTVVNQHIRVDGSCAAACGADDAYRIVAFETTYSIPRFNNVGSQVTVLLVQNPAAYTISGNIWFWDAAGTQLASRAFTLTSRQTLVLNTATVTGAAGVGGTLTLSHDGRYGDLTGKTVALEPSTGFSFDSPMSPRAR